MRLTEKEIGIFKTQILAFDTDASIYLFGSRTNDDEKGGDIDLLVISDKIGFSEKIKIRTGIFNNIEEQKIDLLVRENFNDSFVKVIEDQLICLHPEK
jgi:predicted nucleotidyltransferase